MRRYLADVESLDDSVGLHRSCRIEQRRFAQHPDIVKRLSSKVEAWVDTLPKEYLKTNDKQD